MQWFIAQNNIFSRKLGLGLYDSFLTQVQKYVQDGDQQAKAYLKDIFDKCHFVVQLPKNDKFIKDSHYNFLFSTVSAVLIYDSLVTLCKLTPTYRKIELYEAMSNRIASKIESLTDEELIKLAAIFDNDFEPLSKKDQEKVQQLFREVFEINFKTLRSSDLKSKYNDDDFTEEIIEEFSGRVIAEDSNKLTLDHDEVLKKLPSLSIKVKDYLKTTSLALANANKRQNKKSGGKKLAPVTSETLGYRIAPFMPFSYFQPSNDSDYGFNILKIIDLCGLHFLLVAQRRKFYFDVTNQDEFRNNYDILKKLDQDKLVSLHDQCVEACLEYQAYCEKANDKDLLLGTYCAYIKRTNAFINYLEFLKITYQSFDMISFQVNSGTDWSSSRLFFEFYNIYETAYSLYSTQRNPLCLMSLTNRSPKAIEFFKSSDVQLLKTLNSFVPMTIYQACSMYASFYDQVEDTHPSKVNFKRIVANIMNYSNEVYPTALSLPFATKLDHYTYSEKSYKLDLDAITNSDLVKKGLLPLKYDYLSKELTLNFTQSDYVNCFLNLSYIVDAINYLLLIISNNQSSYKGNNIFFNWYSINATDSENIFNSYQNAINDFNFKSLEAQHLQCLDLLVKISSLKGNLKELYKDNYLTKLLKLTNLYDEDIAKKRSKKSTPESSDPTQLDKLCGEFVIEAKELLKNSFSFLNTYYVNAISKDLEDIAGSRSNYAYIISNLTPVFFSAYILIDDLVFQLKDAPLSLIENFEANSKFYENKEFNTAIYQRAKECFYILFNQDLSLFARMYDSYLCYQDKDYFDKYFARLCPYSYDSLSASSSFAGILTMSRLQALDPKLYSSVRKTAYQHPLVSNSLIFITLFWYCKNILQIYTALLYEFFIWISDAIDKEHIERALPELNLLFNIIKRAERMLYLQTEVYNFKDQCIFNSSIAVTSPDLKLITSNLIAMLDVVVEFIAKYKDKFADLAELNEGKVLNARLDFLQLLHDDPLKALAQYEIHTIDYLAVSNGLSKLLSLKGKGGKNFFNDIEKIKVLESTYQVVNLKILSDYFFGAELSNLICPKCVTIDDYDDIDEDDAEYFDIDLAEEPVYDQSLVDFTKINMKEMSDEQMCQVFTNCPPYKDLEHLRQLNLDQVKTIEHTINLNYEALLDDFKDVLSAEPIFTSFEQPKMKASSAQAPSLEQSTKDLSLSQNASLNQSSSSASSRAISNACTSSSTGTSTSTTSNATQSVAANDAMANATAKANPKAQGKASNDADESGAALAINSAKLAENTQTPSGLNQAMQEPQGTAIAQAGTQDNSKQENNAADKSGVPSPGAHNNSKAEPVNKSKVSELSKNAPNGESDTITVKSNTSMDNVTGHKSEHKIRTTKVPSPSEIEAMKAQIAKKDKLNELNISVRSNQLLGVTVDALLKGVDLIESKTLKSENIEKVILAMALEELHKYDLGPKLHMFDDLINKFSHIIYVSTQAHTLPIARQSLLQLKQKCQDEQLKLQKEIERYKK